MQTFSFDVGGMTCGGCTGSVQRMQSKLDGIGDAVVTLHPGIATVSVDPSRVTPAQIESAITHLGYSAKARPAAHEVMAGSARSIQRTSTKRAGETRTSVRAPGGRPRQVRAEIR